MAKNNQNQQKMNALGSQGKAIGVGVMILLGLFLTISFASAVTFKCYQETANISIICGGLNTGTYNFYITPTGNTLYWSNDTYYMYDGDWNTGVFPYFSPPPYYLADSIMFINYTKPIGAENSSIWTVKADNSTWNFPFNSFNLISCWKAFPDKIEVRINSQPFGINDKIQYDCWNGTEWYNILSEQETCGNPSVCVSIYEEAMDWEITSLNVTVIENSQTFNPYTFVGASENFKINITYNSAQFYGITANLIYQNASYSAYQIGTTENLVFSSTIPIPIITNTTITAPFYWKITLTNSDGIYYVYSGTNNQTITNVQLDDCSVYTYLIYNFTLLDEETKLPIFPSNITDTSIEANLLLSTNGTQNHILNLSQTWINQNPASFCSAIDLANASYRSDMIISYRATGYVQKFQYIDNGVLNANTNPNIFLYDLPISASTSFLVTYQDENYLYVSNAIIQVQRKYVGLGNFITVEEGKTDAGGQTILHLITEDVVYKFLVWKNGVLQYISPEVIALCQASPCQINLRKPFGETPSVSVLGNIVYSLTFNQTQSKVIFNFATNDGTAQTMRLLVQKSDAYENETICDNLLATSGGSIICNIPPAFDNTNYIAQVYTINPTRLIGFISFSSAPTPLQTFGNTGIILSILAFLTLALMGISSGVATIVLGIIGLVFVGLLAIFSSGNILGIGSAIVWLIVAGAIIIFKISNRRIS